MSNSWHTRYSVEKNAAPSASGVSKDSFEGTSPGDDGLHSHLLRLPDGTVVQTQIDGSHMHALNDGKVMDGVHAHIVRLPDGTIVETRTDGAHRHPYGAGGSYEGVHSHILEIDGQLLETQIDGPHYHYRAMEDMSPNVEVEVEVSMSADKSPVAKQLPPGVGPEVTDHSGNWTTDWVDPPPRLPATNSVHYDTDETVNKAAEVVELITTSPDTKEQSAT